MIVDYLLKPSISLILLYAIFNITIRYEQNHQINRFIGLACMLFSLCLIFIPTESLIHTNVYTTTFYTSVNESYHIQESLSKVPENTSTSQFFIIYIAGVGLFLFRSIWGIASLMYYYLTKKKYHFRGFKVVTLNWNASPFAFFNILFIGNHGLKDDGLEAMLVHEQVHRDQFHSIDTLILEFLKILFWFNPAIWLFQRDIKALHEYLADEQVLNKGFNMLDYQKLLFQAKTGISIQLGNYLSNKTSLNKRFKMMTKQKINSNKSYWISMLYLPILAIITGLSACMEKNIIAQTQPDVPAVYAEGMPAMYNTIKKKIKYPKAAKEENSSGLVYVSFTVNRHGNIENITTENQGGTQLERLVVVGYGDTSKPAKEINEDLKQEAISVVKSLGNFTPAKKNDASISSVLTLPIQFKIN
ncbi:M56 family metallopeptidase [Flexithrix dorotheae]|uniref:M56 family metallopeptidase n=1 Tax=Flexithrix dorotheae TaxID=70993 RepID=UPI00038167A2|nr:M56 family metallopeptidase [Flexithrix dorotheae]